MCSVWFGFKFIQTWCSTNSISSKFNEMIRMASYTFGMVIIFANCLLLVFWKSFWRILNDKFIYKSTNNNGLLTCRHTTIPTGSKSIYNGHNWASRFEMVHFLKLSTRNLLLQILQGQIKEKHSKIVVIPRINRIFKYNSFATEMENSNWLRAVRRQSKAYRFDFVAIFNSNLFLSRIFRYR